MNNKPRIYNINISKFISLDSPESVYLAGLLFGDGFVSKQSNYFKFTLIWEDMKEILNVFEKFGDWPIKRIISKQLNRKERCDIGFSCKIIHNFYTNLDYQQKSVVSPHKVLSLIPEDLKHYFWRGFIDADGCWYHKERKGQFSLTGSFKQDWSEVENMFKNIGIGKYTIRRDDYKSGNKSSRIRTHALSDLIKLGNYIYQGYEEDKIGLPRKFEKFQEIKDFFYTNTRNSKPDTGLQLEKSGRYSMQFQINKQKIHVGTFDSKEEAIEAKRLKVLEFGEQYLEIYGFEPIKNNNVESQSHDFHLESNNSV